MIFYLLPTIIDSSRNIYSNFYFYLKDMDGTAQFFKDMSEDSKASLEDVSSQQEASHSNDMNLPAGIEEVQVQGERQLPDDEWMDIIGSGDLKKKVCNYSFNMFLINIYHSICIK